MQEYPPRSRSLEDVVHRTAPQIMTSLALPIASKRLAISVARRAAYSTAAAPSESSQASTSSQPIPTSKKKSQSRINVSLLLSRQPVILREPTELERTFHAYNHQLTRRLQQPFRADFYYRGGSSGEVRFQAEEARRKREIDGITETSGGKKKGTVTAAQEAEVIKEEQVQSRITQADEKGDLTSLKRRLDQTLFLVYKDVETNAWRFPTRFVDVEKSETLHRAAPLSVTSALGEAMDIWMVTHMPVGMMQSEADKTYFLRAHILSGKPAPQPLDTSKVSQYAWLTRDEIRERLLESGKESDRVYAENVGDLL